MEHTNILVGIYRFSVGPVCITRTKQYAAVWRTLTMMMTRQDKTKYNILKSTYEFKAYKAYNKFI